MRATSARRRASPVPRRAVIGWMLYDLGNTIFSFNILSFYFPVWVKGHFNALDIQISLAFGLSMGFVACTSPPAGALSDRAGRRMPFLVASTVLCVACTALLGVFGLAAALLLYALANVFFQLGLVFYDSLLPVVSTPETVGWVGGAGIGIGYVGSFVGLGTGALLLALLPDPHPAIFAATAGLFLLFALPCFLFVRERGAGASGEVGSGERRPRASITSEVAAVVVGLRRTARDVFAHRALGRFLLARFIYADAANTLILFMGIYATREAGFTEQRAQFLLGAGIAAAILGGLAFGKWVDRAGAKPVLQRVLGIWMFTLALAAAVPLVPLPQPVFWLVAAGAGIALGGTWAADRPLMLLLTPPGRVGEFYGVYGMVGRFSAVLGPLIWGVIVSVLHWGRPVAVLSLLLAMVIAAVVLRGVAVAGEGARWR